MTDTTEVRAVPAKTMMSPPAADRRIHNNSQASPVRQPSSQGSPTATKLTETLTPPPERRALVNGHASPVRLLTNGNGHSARLGNRSVTEGYLKTDDRMRMARERREEREKGLAAREEALREKERRARLLYEKQLEERCRKLEEQRRKEEERRAAVEEKRRQQLEEDQERLEALLRRSLERSLQLEHQQRHRQRWGDPENAPPPLLAGSSLPAASGDTGNAPASPHRSPYRGSPRRRPPPPQPTTGDESPALTAPNTPKRERLRMDRRGGSPIRRPESPALARRSASPATPKLTPKHHNYPSSPMRQRPITPVTEPSSPMRQRPTAPLTEPSSPMRQRPIAPVTEPSSPMRQRPIAPVTEPSSPMRQRPLAPVTEPSSPMRQRPLAPVTNGGQRSDSSAAKSSVEKAGMNPTSASQTSNGHSDVTAVGKEMSGRTNEEASRLLAERRRLERIKADEERKSREEEERKSREEEEKQQREKEAQAQMERKEELQKEEERHKLEEQERQQRKKRIEEIMKRTRKGDSDIKVNDAGSETKEANSTPPITNGIQTKQEMTSEVNRSPARASPTPLNGPTGTTQVSECNPKTNNSSPMISGSIKSAVPPPKNKDSPIKDSPVTTQTTPTNNKDRPITSQAPPTNIKDSPITSSAPSPKDRPVTTQAPPTNNKDNPVTTQAPSTNNKTSPIPSQTPPTNGKDSPITSQTPPTNGKDSPITSQTPPTNSKDSPITSQAPPTNSKDSPITSQAPPPKRDISVTLQTPPLTNDTPQDGRKLQLTTSTIQGGQTEAGQATVSATPKVTITSTTASKTTVVAMANKLDSKENGPRLSVLPRQPSVQLDGVEGVPKEEPQSMDVSPVSKDDLVSIPEFSPLQEEAGLTHTNTSCPSSSPTRALLDLLDLTGHVAYPCPVTTVTIAMSSSSTTSTVNNQAGDCNRNLVTSSVTLSCSTSDQKHQNQSRPIPSPIKPITTPLPAVAIRDGGTTALQGRGKVDA
ncbi:MAP7 domain-containing protein 2-like isoform X2 [Alosa sapidissima]|uniref:MAP7 domain-containing protein 2-like isoform X2 n=1 Tax=Alosa sapidissima TaxID=34773 RepID=UPI001C09DE1A|nr:MAP7 domain-containing protein 2-like isoform X2 [Alosa sapidissima]